MFQGFDGRLVRRAAADTRPSGSVLKFSQYRRYLSIWFGLSPDEFLSKFGSHSDRIGGASAAANAGVPMERWGQHGSWRSTSAQRSYMELSEENILSVSRAITADPTVLDVCDSNQDDDESPSSGDGDGGDPVVEGTPEGIFRWSANE